MNRDKQSIVNKQEYLPKQKVSSIKLNLKNSITKYLFRYKKELRIKIIIKSFKFGFKLALSSTNPRRKKIIVQKRKKISVLFLENIINSIFPNKFNKINNTKFKKKNNPPDNNTLFE